MSYLYLVPGVLALSLKLLIIVLGGKGLLKAHPVLLGFFAGLLGVNVFEILAFFHGHFSDGGMVILKGYYLFILATFLLMAAYPFAITEKLSKTVCFVLGGAFTLAAVVTVIPNLAIAGVKSIGYSVTRVQGPYYGIIVLTLLGSLLTAMIGLVWVTCRSKEHFVQRRAYVFLLAVAPLILTATGIIISMLCGVKVNGSMYISVSVCVTLWVLVYTEQKEHLYRFISLVPYSREYKFFREMSLILGNPEDGLKKAKVLFEEELLKQAMMYSKDNKTQAAKILGVSRQTVNRKMKTAKL